MVKYAGWFLAMEKKHYADPCLNRETTSIPVNPRTTRPVGYAFVDLKSSDEAQKAIDNLSGKDILDRKVSVQLARKPEAGGEKTYEGRTTVKVANAHEALALVVVVFVVAVVLGALAVADVGYVKIRPQCLESNTDDLQDATTGIEPLPLNDVTNAANMGTESTDKNGYAPRTPRPPKQRGPPEDGIASTTKVMVANLPYDLSEEKV